MKKLITLIAIAFCLSASAQQQQPSKPVHMEGKEVDSTKSRLAMISQAIASIKALTQGEAADIQKILADIYATVIRKEEKEVIKK